MKGPKTVSALVCHHLVCISVYELMHIRTILEFYDPCSVIDDESQVYFLIYLFNVTLVMLFIRYDGILFILKYMLQVRSGVLCN